MLYIFDKDLTLVESPTGTTPNSLEEQVLMPNVKEVCGELRAAGHVLAIASNQGGVAFGIFSEETATLLVKNAAEAIEAKDFQVCCHHPNGKIAELARECEDRKPSPGMLIKLMNRLGFPPEQTIFIGDAESDRQAAEAAGVRFIVADVFFKRNLTV